MESYLLFIDDVENKFIIGKNSLYSAYGFMFFPEKDNFEFIQIIPAVKSNDYDMLMLTEEYISIFGSKENELFDQNVGEAIDLDNFEELKEYTQNSYDSIDDNSYINIDIDTSSPSTVRGFSGDHYYQVNSMSSTQEVKIIDTQGNNVFNIDNLDVQSGIYTTDAIQLTLSNGAVINILSANLFEYDVGGDKFVDFNTFTSNNYGWSWTS